MLGNRIKLSLMALALPLIASSAMAASTAGPSGELIVTGEYVPRACFVTLANNGTIDYGRMTASSFTNDYTNLASKTLANAITVTCPVATSLAIDWIDNRTSSVEYIKNTFMTGRQLPAGLSTYAPYGLGVDSASNKIGNYIAELDNLKVDGATAYAPIYKGYAFIANSGATYTAIPSGAPTTTNLVYNIVDETGNLLVGSVFTMDYSVNAQIAPINTLNLSKEINLDGSVTVSLYYL